MAGTAIETVYNDYRFRSRLEARWAVFFDVVGVKYEYEKEGFDIDGKRYLPDFWLPELRLWVEIKGELTWRTITGSGWSRNDSPELELCEKLRDATGCPVACIVGTPGSERIYFYAWDVTDSSGGGYYDDDSRWCLSNGVVTLDTNSGRDRTFISDNLMGEQLPWFSWPHEFGCETGGIVADALKAARQARFEYGESGRVA